MSQQTHGIVNAKKFLTILGAQVQAAATMDSDGDGQISTMEWTNFGGGLAIAVFSSFSTVSAALPEFGDLKGEEFDELTTHVLGIDFLPDSKDQAEDLVKYVLFVANTNRKFVGNLVALSKGKAIEVPSAA